MRNPPTRQLPQPQQSGRSPIRESAYRLETNLPNSFGYFRPGPCPERCGVPCWAEAISGPPFFCNFLTFIRKRSDFRLCVRPFFHDRRPRQSDASTAGTGPVRRGNQAVPCTGVDGRFPPFPSRSLTAWVPCDAAKAMDRNARDCFLGGIDRLARQPEDRPAAVHR